MRTFIAIMAAATLLISTETADGPDDIRKRLLGDEDGDDEKGDRLLLVEVPNGTNLVIPDEKTIAKDPNFIAIELAEFSAATHLDVAGVQRSAAGRPIDAMPGSLDAAFTGMQHDIGSGTVRNTVSPEPTPSKIVEEHLREDPGEAEQPAPKADQATTR